MEIQKKIEYVNKAKLLEYLDNQAFNQNFGAIYAKIIEIFKVIQSGEFDEDVQSIISQQSAEIKKQREAIERVIADIEQEHRSREFQAKYSTPEKLQIFNQGAEYGLKFALERIRAVLAGGTNDSSGVSGVDEQETEQVPRQENNR